MDRAFNGYSDGDIDTNHTDNPSLNVLVANRRQTILGGLRASALAFVGTSMLAACDDDDVVVGDPVVDAGTDATVSTGAFVTLQGSATQGAINPASFAQTGGPAVELTTGSGNTATFIAPAVAAPTALTFTLTAGGVSDSTVITVNPAALTFSAVPKNLDDIVTVPAGYSVTVLTRLGDPIDAATPDYVNDGSDANFATRIGDHGDALYYFGLDAGGSRDDNSSVRGLLVQNHENLNEQYLHPAGPTNVSDGPRPAAEALKEIEAHGLSVVEVQDTTGARDWEYVQNSAFNRRITPMTPMAINGPVRGSAMLATQYSTNGTDGRGTINNCANGYAAWGTLLTCEENWAGYFRRDDDGPGSDNANRTARELTALRRYGVRSSTGNYAWSSAEPSQDIFRRWDARATGASATDDYRNEMNQFGWVVEIDPYDPASTPRKRTALGRMGHEGAWLGKLVSGQKVAVYMGDDSRREYMYKFVSDAAWDPADAHRTDRLAVGDKYLDSGTLYVARFNADGSGTWLPLVFGSVPNRPAVGSEPEYVFADQADILVNTRLAADAVGATPMDRPEWTALNPVTGEIYLTLTNNNASNRPIDGTDAANPRHYVEPRGSGTTTGNPNGHILRLREGGDNSAATSFLWDIYLFGADSIDAGASVNISGLDADNDFSSPDGLWFSREQNPAGQINPLLWIQTDDGAFTDRTNNQMLAALPGFVGDGEAKTITNVAADTSTAQQATFAGQPATSANLKRFLTGPLECEITGVDTTPDGRTLFVGIQHPGENGDPANITSNWPQSQEGNATGRPRSGVVVVTKDTGGVVGL
ncbi:PhoX family protein [Alteraurantiacibacter aquimixticola]|uniref:PhoX family phosphatase n=1 Tax=Alteraurantiacibacter aquimixticola TaxID=2489173 RepID=A0A4T3F0Q0_9SPHN|nr:PhoX family phosphatase [Alteraurantiacibacter aquimixticola]TIX50619.1 PhoX family phosphatase [Alteraurantiacibacter aquimixticola]